MIFFGFVFGFFWFMLLLVDLLVGLLSIDLFFEDGQQFRIFGFEVLDKA